MDINIPNTITINMFTANYIKGRDSYFKYYYYIHTNVKYGCFPDKLKIVKVKPLYKKMILLLLTITDLFLFFPSFKKYLRKLYKSRF